ncbi:ribosome hibernation-promoting factor, HPF/YfiA family [Desulfonatronovibrio hydrogenovorans]|uniref:ribosome hibernation-promoting factor, HPF/YfiA family n=1 Tax=Desulfonatronovibrio hydrogenovorans TaxID=53245 RepID=UPI00048D7147|nr:ribosome-associated translation inhibitor RaiA [Desulfonatronovibrio hydrogenovorans]
MQIKFNFKNFEPSEHLKKYARERYDKLSKYLSEINTAELQVNLEVEKFRHIAEVILTAKDIHISATEDTEDMYSTVDLSLDKLEAQLRKQRGKVKDKKKKAREKQVRMDIVSFGPVDSGKREPSIVATDHYEPKPMSLDEAAMQLESLNYEFLVFLNSDTDRINVVYRRKNGDFGFIDPGA